MRGTGNIKHMMSIYMYKGVTMSQCYNDFIAIIENPGSKNDTWKFWCGYFSMIVWHMLACTLPYMVVHGASVWKFSLNILLKFCVYLGILGTVWRREDLCVTLEGTKMHALPLHESHTGLRACVVHTLFICSGCDNVCFFDGFGKQ